MSPYGEKISDFLWRKRLTQKDFALSIGVLPNHVSQVISGSKGPFNQFIQHKINEVLNLSEHEKSELEHLREISCRTFRLPDDARPIEYQIAALLSGQSSSTPDRFLAMAKLALEAHTSNFNHA